MSDWLDKLMKSAIAKSLWYPEFVRMARVIRELARGIRLYQAVRDSNAIANYTEKNEDAEKVLEALLELLDWIDSVSDDAKELLK